MSLDHDQLRALEAAIGHPGWRILVAEFDGRRAAAVREVFGEATSPERRAELVWRQRGRDEVMEWFDRQLEDGRRLRKVD